MGGLNDGGQTELTLWCGFQPHPHCWLLPQAEKAHLSVKVSTGEVLVRKT